jgi:hypothetical protein
MNENRLPDYLAHMQQAATEACALVDGMEKVDFIEQLSRAQSLLRRMFSASSMRRNARWLLRPTALRAITKH